MYSSNNMISDYRNLQFKGTNPENFYTYKDIGTLLAKCKGYTDKVVNCRTIGILESEGGRFFLKEMGYNEEAPQIRVAMQYVKRSLPSTVQPYVVQIFGVLQWTNKPVIFARIVQVLDPATGIRLNKALKCIASLHLACLNNEEQWEDE